MTQTRNPRPRRHRSPKKTYATGNNGSDTATASDLKSIEPSLNDTSSATLSSVTIPSGDAYQVVSTAAHTGDTFRITESTSGTEANTCAPGAGGSGSPGTCPTSHTW